ncbi:helicase domain protein [alpha proteobacterium U9-1i]|nr:helicase domain protein [alpha proteobacterium U9-1i]
MTSFENVAPALARALAQRGFETLTPVQDAVLAPELQAADLIVSAQTGSGKTVAFGMTLAADLLGETDRLGAPGQPLALIIAPTRELAMQVTRELEWLYAQAGGVVASCVGGMDARDERRALFRGAHIVVGTPGRLADHIRRGSLAMESLKVVVLDEADEMLNLGFREELEFILDASPAERRTLMFSATMPRAIEALAKKYQRGAVRVNTVSTQKQHIDIEYRALVAAGHESENAIFNVLRYHDATNAIVFCGTRAAVTRLASRLSNRGLAVVALSGELSQNQRTHALQSMRDHRAQVCVATDVAARGIDLPDLELVIHADLPKNTEALLHRSGRTGRAGRKGTSVLIVPYSARRRTERLLRDAGIQARWGEPPSADDIKQRDDERLLADPLLMEKIQESEHAIVAKLLTEHSAESIAAAFVRVYRKGQAAPEDLAPTPSWQEERPERNRRDAPPARAAASRDNFEGGAWVSLSVGRAQSAEPRWLIPMLCKAGGLTKRQLGSIRIQQNETHVELDAGSIDAFFTRVGEGGRLEKNIRVTRLDGAPRVQSERPQRAADNEFAERPRRRPEGVERPPHAKAKPAHKSDRKPHDAKRAGRPANKKQKWHPAD